MTDQLLDDTALENGTEPAEGSSRLERAGYQLVEQLLTVGINGFGPFKSARDSATEAMRGRSQAEAVTALVRSHVALAAGQGFVTNLGGFATMPVSLPANVSAAYLIQTHLAASIAYVYGHDADSEAVRTTILLCLLGNAGSEVMKKAGIKIGEKLALSMIKKLPVSVIHKINRRVGFALVAKFGTKRATITLAKGVPLVGGAVGGSADAITTRAVGAFANKTFRASEEADASA
jgi:hypothetical protein